MAICVTTRRVLRGASHRVQRGHHVAGCRWDDTTGVSRKRERTESERRGVRVKVRVKALTLSFDLCKSEKKRPKTNGYLGSSSSTPS
jgi:hypothetical protein